ncbi:MAG: biotin--[acetyl-CoA-carboxylase] ligase [Bacteroidales bacterium]
MFTLLLCPQSIKARNQFIISQLVSLGILKTLNQLKEGFRVKWPNDIYYHNKKVAGILIENDLSGQTLYNSFIGIGLNVNQKEFTSDAPNPVSLFQILGTETDRTLLLEKMLQNILYYYEIALEGNYTLIRDKYMKQLFRNEGYHPFNDAGRRFLARIKHIHPTGHLILEDESGSEQTYDFKEVEFVL